MVRNPVHGIVASEFFFAMRILLVNKFAHYEGGSARYILDLYDLLKRQGHVVSFFAMQPNADEAGWVRLDLEKAWGTYWVSPVHTRTERFDWQGIRTAFRCLWSFEAARKIDRLIRDFKPDVVHLNTFFHQISPSILPVIKRHRIPMVMTVHGYELVYPDYLLKASQFEDCMQKRFFNMVLKRHVPKSLLSRFLLWFEFVFHRFLGVYRWIDAFLVPSQFLKSLMEHHGFSPVFHLPYPYEPIPGVRQSRAGNAFVYVARLSPEKGVRELVESYRRCLEKFPEFPPLIFFSRTGPLLAPIQKLCSEEPFRNHMFLKPFRGKEMLADAFACARTMVVPSYPYLENFPYSVLESFSFYRPVISSGLGGLSEMVREGERGWNVLTQTENVSPEAYIDRLAYTLERAVQTSDQELSHMGQRGYEYVSQLKPVLYYEKLMNLYRQVCTKKF